MNARGAKREQGSAAVGAGELLPSVRLPSLNDEREVRLRHGRGPRVIACVHPPGCVHCRAFIDELNAAGERMARWNAGLIVVAPATPADDRYDLSGHQGGESGVVLDPDGVLGSRRPAIMIADRFGEVYFSSESASGHALPTVDEVLEWLRFIAIQCPECPGPEGVWRSTAAGPVS